jgi:uncharacterized caspase-like protein
MAKKLTEMGFKVTESLDASGDKLVAEVQRYFDSLNPGDISLVYYSGHGFQANGESYLVPVDFDDAHRSTAYRATALLERGDQRAPRLQVVILDACREDLTHAFGGSWAKIEGGKEAYVITAVQPKKLASDGIPGRHGLFTSALLRHIDEPEDIDVVFRKVASSTTVASELEQLNAHGRREDVMKPERTSTVT